MQLAYGPLNQYILAKWMVNLKNYTFFLFLRPRAYLFCTTFYAIFEYGFIYTQNNWEYFT